VIHHKELSKNERF